MVVPFFGMGSGWVRDAFSMPSPCPQKKRRFGKESEENPRGTRRTEVKRKRTPIPS
jgi:hypothetical protein